MCKDLNNAVSQLNVQVDAEHGITVATDRAISSALIVSELLTNAAKYAYKEQPGGRIWVAVARSPENKVVLSGSVPVQIRPGIHEGGGSY